MADQVKFKKGNSTNLDSLPVENGSLIYTTDDHRLYIDALDNRFEHQHLRGLSALWRDDSIDMPGWTLELYNYPVIGFNANRITQVSNFYRFHQFSYSDVSYYPTAPHPYTLSYSLKTISLVSPMTGYSSGTITLPTFFTFSKTIIKNSLLTEKEKEITCNNLKNLNFSLLIQGNGWQYGSTQINTISDDTDSSNWALIASSINDTTNSTMVFFNNTKTISITQPQMLVMYLFGWCDLDLTNI